MRRVKGPDGLLSSVYVVGSTMNWATIALAWVVPIRYCILKAIGRIEQEDKTAPAISEDMS